MNTKPPWIELLPFPPGLADTFIAWLIAHINDDYAPRDSTEQFLAARIAQAMARLHLSALREPETPDSLWLRYEANADRQLRDAQRAWQALRAADSSSQAPPPAQPLNPPTTPKPAAAPNTVLPSNAARPPAPQPIPTRSHTILDLTVGRPSPSTSTLSNGNGKHTPGNGKAT